MCPIVFIQLNSGHVPKVGAKLRVVTSVRKCPPIEQVGEWPTNSCRWGCTHVSNGLLQHHRRNREPSEHCTACSSPHLPDKVRYLQRTRGKRGGGSESLPLQILIHHTIFTHIDHTAPINLEHRLDRPAQLRGSEHSVRCQLHVRHVPSRDGPSVGNRHSTISGVRESDDNIVFRMPLGNANRVAGWVPGICPDWAFVINGIAPLQIIFSCP
mmetsp:Transcript_6677/g.11832  ORF Transcript_6677/g.11832 Transcript_6677/m.11832 type:complete len:212 (+) Transcript_6677:776-1411(+)